jgi:peptidoglycan/xylan/chitin deacetylase (PgdA/CDA1 family)
MRKKGLKCLHKSVELVGISSIHWRNQMKRFTPIILAVLIALSSFITLATFPASALATNEVPNPSAETVSSTNSALPDGWSTGNWGTNTAIFTYDTTGHTGTRSLKVQLTKYTSGDAKWYFTPQAVTAGNSYTYSDYYKSTIASTSVAQFDDGNGDYTYVNLNPNIPASASAWTQTTTNFVVPAGAKNVTIFHLINAVGTLSIDDASLTPVTPVVVSTPTVSITTPAANAAETGTVNLAASATDTNGIASVQFKVDGIVLGSAVTASPYQTSWDTTTATNGTHIITAIATNTQGVSTTSSPVSITVNNAVATPPVTTTTNLLANPSVETPDPALSTQPQSWLKGGWGTNTSTLTYATTGAQDGTKSLTVKTTAYTSGDAKWYFAPVAVAAGSQYVFSDYYKATITTDVVAQFDNGSDTYSYLDLGTPAAATSWTQYTKSFTVPAGMKNVTVFHLISGVGTLQTDNFSLTLASVVVTPPVTPTSNLVANPSFETANGTEPANWIQDSWGTNTAAFSYATTGGHTGNDSAKITMSNYTDGDAKWYFTPLALTPNAQYTYSTWYKTTAKIAATAMYTDAEGNVNYFTMPTPLVGSSASTTWQSYKATFQVPSDAVSMSILFLIEGNGVLQTDDASVTPYTPTGFTEPLISLTFDDGWTSIYDNALPLLEKYGLVSTQYIISSYLGQPDYMTMAQVKAFQTAGSEIGSHTVDHPDLTTLTSAQLTTELNQSQKTLQKDFGTSAALNIASPYGAYNQTVITAMKKYYQAHRSVDVGYNSKDDFNPFDILVQNITDTTTPADVASWIAQAKATNTWLVIVYHSVTPTGVFDADTTSTADLDAELQDIQASGIPVKTMTAALAEVDAQL